MSTSKFVCRNLTVSCQYSSLLVDSNTCFVSGTIEPDTANSCVICHHNFAKRGLLRLAMVSYQVVLHRFSLCGRVRIMVQLRVKVRVTVRIRT